MTNYEAIGKKWTKDNGEVRYYVNDWKDMIGLEVYYYKTGNVSSVFFGDKQWSNNFYKKYVMGTKVWIGENGKVHVDYCRDEDIEEIIIEAVEKRIAQLDKPRRETGQYQIIPCDENGAIDITQKTEGFDTIEDFKAGIREWASSGWTFCGLHPWHMGANLDQIYVKKVA